MNCVPIAGLTWNTIRVGMKVRFNPAIISQGSFKSEGGYVFLFKDGDGGSVPDMKRVFVVEEKHEKWLSDITKVVTLKHWSNCVAPEMLMLA